MESRAAAEARDTPQQRGAPAHERAAQPVPRALSLLSLQRSAGNAAVAQLLGRSEAANGVQRKEEPAAEQAPAGSAPASQAPAGQTVPTDWFVDFDQMKKNGGAAGERHADDVLVVKELLLHHGKDVVPLKGFDAASSGQAHLGSVDHHVGTSSVSGTIEYASSRDVKVAATLNGAAEKKGVAAHQKQVADKAAQDYVSGQFHAAEGDQKALELGAAAAADAALAADAQAAAGDAPAPQAPTSKVDISVVGRHTDMPSLPSVDYDVAAPSDVRVYVVVPSEQYKASASTTTSSHGGEKVHKANETREHERSGAKVDVSGSGSTTTTETADAHIKRVTELKQKFATSYVRNAHTALQMMLSESYRNIYRYLMELKNKDESTTTSTPWQPRDVDVPADGEDEVKKEDKHWYDSVVDFVKDKVGGYVKNKFWSWADQVVGKELPLYRAIPGAVKDWFHRKITDLVWKGGEWLWHKIHPGQPEVQHSPEKKVSTPGGTTTTTDVTNEQSKAMQVFNETAEAASRSYSTDVTEMISRGFEQELSVKTEVDVGSSKSKTDTKSGSAGAHGESEHGKDTVAQDGDDVDSGRQETHTYTTDTVRIETGKPVIELTVRPK